MTKQAHFWPRFTTIAVTFLGIFTFSLIFSSIAKSTEANIDLSDQAISRAIRESKYKFNTQNSQVTRLRVFTIDTRDQLACTTLKEVISSFKPANAESDTTHLCDENSEHPMQSIVVMDNIDSLEFRTELDKKFLTSTEKNLANDTRNLALGMGMTMGVLWFSPTISKWDNKQISEDPRSLLKKWYGNVREGPVWDKDDLSVNYVGHPIAGAATYVIARQNGSSQLASFGYSVAMSTFFWEYGWEALAEIPSKQDLVITPVFGALLGELIFTVSKQIENDRNEVLGSKRLGKIAMVVLNPARAFSDSINRAVGSKVVHDARADLVLRSSINAREERANFIGLQMSFMFNAL